MSKTIKWIGGTRDVPALYPPLINAGDIRKDVDDELAKQLVDQKLAEIAKAEPKAEKKSEKKDKEGGDN